MAAITSDTDTISEKAYRRIRADILFGRLAPSQKLTLDRMKEAYGTSISTLREILNRLSSEKLVLAEGQRGFEVAPISAGDLREIGAMRQLLEQHALEQSFAAGDMEWEGRVVAAHHKLSLMEERMKASDSSATETWKRYDWEFHQALISACGSRMLLEAHGAVFDKYLRYQILAMTNRGAIAVREHKTFLDCALKRDIKGATALLVLHVEGGVENALASGKIR